MKQGWESKKLGDICTFKNGRAFKKTEWVQDGLPIIRIANLNNPKASFNFFDGEFDKSIFIEKGDLLFSWSGTIGSSFGPHIWNSNSGLLNQHIHKIGIKDDTLRDFLYYLFLWITSELEKLTNGAVGLVHVNKSTLVNYPVLLPSIDKQSEVVTKLDQCFEAIDKARANTAKNLENAKELFQSKLNDIFSQKGEGWVEKKLGDVCSLIKRGIPPKYIETGGIQVVNQKCIRNHKVNLTLARRHNIVLKSVSQEKLIQIGDVLVNSTGVGTLGRVAQVRDSIISDTTVDTHVTIVRPIPGLFFTDFFGYALMKIEDEITSSGEGTSGQTELARTKLQNNFIVSYPTSLEEQKQIVKILDSLKKQTQSLESKYQQELNSLAELKKSILQKAFEGELV